MHCELSIICKITLTENQETNQLSQQQNNYLIFEQYPKYLMTKLY